jgi:hypothetical protein
MKPIINRNKKNSVINKSNNYQRRSTLNPKSSNKINIILLNQELPSMFKTNKTLQKYIDQKLSSIKPISQTKKNDLKYINKSHFQTRNNSLNTKKNNNKNKSANKRHSKNESNNTKDNKLNKGRNNKKKILSLKKEYKTNQNYSSFNNMANLINKKNNINKKFKSPVQTKGKLIKNFYQNYNSSISTGISMKTNTNDVYKSCSNFLDNNSLTKYNNSDNEMENQDFEIIPLMNKDFKVYSNWERNNKSINNNYEIDSSEDNIMDNKIILKKCENGSPITFGNSFSYTNSKKSSSTRRVLKNNDNEEADIKNDENIFLLKSQNETLKKELKESNEQIIFLKGEIEKLIKKKKIKNCKYALQSKNKCSQPTSYAKRHSKNKSCLKQDYFNINNYHSNDIKINKKIMKISKKKKE